MSTLNTVYLAIAAVPTTVVATGNITHIKQGYTSEYSVECANAAISYEESAEVCRAKSPEWILAIVVDQEAEDFLEKATDQDIWLGSDRNVTTPGGLNRFDFVWGLNTKLPGVAFAYTERISPQYYDAGCSDPGNIYCNFPAGEPASDIYFRCGSSLLTGSRLIIPSTSSNSGGKRYWGLQKSNCPYTKCLACERIIATNTTKAPISTTKASLTTTKAPITTTKASVTTTKASGNTTKGGNTTATTRVTGASTTKKATTTASPSLSNPIVSLKKIFFAVVSLSFIMLCL